VNDGLRTVEAECVVRADRPTAFAAVGRLVVRLWGAGAEVALEDAPYMVVHTVSAEGGGDVDAWLTWELSETGGGWTKVRLVCDEADTGAAPPPELDRVLDLLRTSIKVASGC
jgi:hypothetical protein